MKIVWFTKYSRKGASSRLRSMQFFPGLLDLGFEIIHLPLFDDVYLEKLYGGKSVRLIALRCYVKRLFQIIKLSKTDIIVIEKELFPYLPATFERLMVLRGLSYIVDYDDAIFITYERNLPGPLRMLMKHKIRKVMANAHTVVAGNSYLASYAEESGASHVVVIPTVVDTERYQDQNAKELDKLPVIGWVGSPTTVPYLEPVLPVLEKIYKKKPFLLKVVGGTLNGNCSFPMEHLPWTEASEAETIAGFDLGIMPLPKTEWAKGKCAYKLIQYMAAGLPVVATRFGANEDVVLDGTTGILVNSDADWEEALTSLLNHKDLRANMGVSGRKRVVDHYSLNAAFSQWITVVDGLK